MLEPLGLVVDVVDVQAERASEVELEQPVVADDLDRDLLARRSQPHAAVGRCSTRSRAASFLTIVLADAGETVAPRGRGP